MKAFLLGLVCLTLCSFVGPELAQAQLVAEPCTPGIDDCPSTNREAARYGTCEFVETIQNVFNFVIQISSILVVFMLAFYGLWLVVSGGNTTVRDKLKEYLVNVVVGLLLIIAAYAIVNTIITILVADEKVKTSWGQIECIYPTAAVEIELYRGRPTAVPGVTEGALSSAAVEAGVVGVEPYREAICARAAARGIGSECTKILALMSVESAGRPSVESPAGAVGLMQIMPATAKTLDPALSGLSDTEIKNRLKDPNYNLDLGIKFYAQLKEEFGEDRLVWAAYNGGRGANGDSRDCPGLRRWECEWDNPAKTIPNTGYKETRNYVPNIMRALERL